MKSILTVAALAASLCASGFVFADAPAKTQPQQQQQQQQVQEKHQCQQEQKKQCQQEQKKQCKHEQQQQQQAKHEEQQQQQQPVKHEEQQAKHQQQQQQQQQQAKHEEQQAQSTEGQSSQVGETHSTQSTGEQSTGEQANDQVDLKILARLKAVDQAEIQVAQEALSKSNDQRVKDFAQKMIDDHSRADQDIKDMVNTDHLTLPAYTPTTPDEIAQAKAEQDAMDKLAKLTGSDFDKEFARDMVTCHQHVVDCLNALKDQVSRSDVRDWLNDTALPVVQEHLQDAQQLVQELGA